MQMVARKMSLPIIPAGTGSGARTKTPAICARLPGRISRRAADALCRPSASISAAGQRSVVNNPPAATAEGRESDRRTGKLGSHARSSRRWTGSVVESVITGKIRDFQFVVGESENPQASLAGSASTSPRAADRSNCTGDRDSRIHLVVSGWIPANRSSRWPARSILEKTALDRNP
jgi:hypothetical protein